jgi:hypothetical protein
VKQTFTLFNTNNSNEKKIKPANVTSISKFLNSVLIGIMLGDGGIYRTSLKSNSRLEISFGQKYQSFAESLFPSSSIV